MKFKHIAFSFAIVAAVVPAEAQDSKKEADLPACYTIRGEPVLVDFVDGLGTLARATRLQERPTIKIDPAILRDSSWEWTVFKVAHECGHHALGHLDPRSTSFGHDAVKELEADCYAGSTMAHQSLGSKEAHSVGSILSRNPPESPAMVPGAVRATKLMSCYDVARGFPRKD